MAKTFGKFFNCPHNWNFFNNQLILAWDLILYTPILINNELSGQIFRTPYEHIANMNVHEHVTGRWNLLYGKIISNSRTGLHRVNNVRWMSNWWAWYLNSFISQRIIQLVYCKKIQLDYTGWTCREASTVRPHQRILQNEIKTTLLFHWTDNLRKWMSWKIINPRSNKWR
jgi:hypothetical protein